MSLLITIPTILNITKTSEGFGVQISGDLVMEGPHSNIISYFNNPRTNLNSQENHQWEDNHKVKVIDGQSALRKLNKLRGRCCISKIST